MTTCILIRGLRYHQDQHHGSETPAGHGGAEEQEEQEFLHASPGGAGERQVRNPVFVRGMVLEELRPLRDQVVYQDN